MGAPEVPHGNRDTRSWKPAALLLTGHHAQASAVLDHSRTLPQGDGRARPAFTRRAVGSECNRMVLEACDGLDKPFASGFQGIAPEGKCSSQVAPLGPLYT